MFQNPAWGFPPPRATSHNPNLATPSYRQVHPTANNGSAEVMGRQARDRPPNRVMDCLNWDIALGAAIAPPLLLLGLGLLPGLSPTAPAIGGGLSTMVSCKGLVIMSED